MKKIATMFAAVLASVVTLGTVSEAQVFTPTYQSPRLVDELTLAVSDGPGSLAIEGIWRGGPLGLRVGYADAREGLLMIGGEVRSPIAIAGAPLGLAFTGGGQALVGDSNAFGFQAGLTAGYTFTGEGLAFTPYIHPRIAGVRQLHENDLRLRALADVGADLEFHTNLLLSFGVGLGNVGSNWGFGLGWRR
jgi:hypothetical protein